MRINARLDDDAAAQIEYLTRETGAGVSHVVRESVACYYAQVKAGQRGPTRFLALIGKGDSASTGDGSGDVASTVKQRLGVALGAKHRPPKPNLKAGTAG